MAPADGAFDHLLHLFHHDAVARDGLPVDDDLQVGLPDDPVREDRGRLDGRNLFEEPLHPDAHLFDGLQIGPLDLDPHRRPHAGLEHHDARRDRLKHRGAGHTGDLGRAHDLVPDLARGSNPRPGLTLGI